MIDNRILMCLGELAKTPYHFDKIFINLYSIEELCYVIHENAYMLDKDILDIELVKWIDTELKLPELAKDLYPMINQNAMASAFAGKILEYAGYYSKDEIEKTESILRLNISMSVFEKWKAKADFLFENKHYNIALKEYEHLLEKIEDDDRTLKSRVYNNMGVTYMALSLYESAEKCFLSAYELDNNETAFKHYLAAKRLELSDDEYISFIADNEEAYLSSLPIETELKNLGEEFTETDDAKKIEAVLALKTSGSSTEFYEQVGHETELLKKSYRDSLFEAEGV